MSRFILLAFALLYFFTLDTGLRPAELEGGDLITHQYAQVQGRPSNAPGYPLYTMGGWLWFRLGRLLLGPDHNPVPILASYSTLWALLALWLLYRLILEVTELPPKARPELVEGLEGQGGHPAATLPPRLGGWGGHPVATLVTAFYGVTYFFWYYAVTTEQYTSAVAWTLAVVWLAFRWERTRRDGYLLGIALLTGVGLAHMVTTLFIIPPLLWLVLSQDPRLSRRPGLIAKAVALAALPLLSYAFVYVRGAQHPEWRGVGQWESTWQWFWSFISTRQGRSELTWSLTPFFTPEFPSLIWGELTVPGLIAGLLGLATLGRRRAIMLYATLAIYLVFCWIDRLGNWYQVIMPAYALLAVGIAAGADWVWRLGRGVPRAEQLSRFALYAALIALVAYRGLISYPRADSRDRPEDTALIPGWAILADDPPPGTAILGTLPEALALNYLTEIWGQRPDLRSVTSDQARALLAAGATTPLAATVAALPLVPAEVSPDAHYSALGRTLVAVSADPQYTLPFERDVLRSRYGPAGPTRPPAGPVGPTRPPAGPVGPARPPAGLQDSAAWQPWTHDFGSELRLLGGWLKMEQDGAPVVLLVWQAVTRPSADWSVSVRLAQEGQEIAQVDRQHPVAGAYPTGRWSPGEVVADAYPFTLPSGATPDELVVILYRRTADGGFVNLDVARFKLPRT